MPLLLTILSVLAVWTFLAVLIAGLLLILKPLEAVRTSLEQIAMGVRAIEHQAAPLGARTGALADAMSEANGAVGAAEQGLAEVDRDLQAAAPALQRRA